MDGGRSTGSGWETVSELHAGRQAGRGQADPGTHARTHALEEVDGDAVGKGAAVLHAGRLQLQIFDDVEPEYCEPINGWMDESQRSIKPTTTMYKPCSRTHTRTVRARRRAGRRAGRGSPPACSSPCGRRRCVVGHTCGGLGLTKGWCATTPARSINIAQSARVCM